MGRFLASLAAIFLLLHPAVAEVGDVADFSGLDEVAFHRNPIRAEELKGKVVLLEYWGIMCHPCRKAMPELQELYEANKGRGLVVLAVHCQSTTERDMEKFINARGLTFPVCARFNLPQAPIPSLVPCAVLIGADGKVLAIGKPWQIIPKAKEELDKLYPPVPCP